MNKKLEELAYIKFPDKPIWDGKYECDANWEAREKWLEEAKEIYNLAIEDIKEEVERLKELQDDIIRMSYAAPSAVAKKELCHQLFSFIDSLQDKRREVIINGHKLVMKDGAWTIVEAPEEER